ncbi:rod shape-determining protein MreC [Luminiphilus syltensis NOR5-1B]|uniref:Cell shape-determining protein MreC n=1 Tax=Luminiphilus syltensis NOR5-1B TaxID=565045 RepID=B8KR96_9GAMM|nr:rod shape-determining protein MreC [Luminiphilus syltensis NOR5-1B]
MVVSLCAVLFYFRDDPRLAPARAVVSDVTSVFYSIAAAPVTLWNGVTGYFVSQEQLREDNERLRQQNFIFKGRLQRLAALQAENARYRALLNSAGIVDDDVMVAEIIAVASDPARHLLVLDKGVSHGVVAGQPLLGADGLMGQVVWVGNSSSRAMLITDSSHALPVQVVRNGVRAVAEGTGGLDRLIIRHVAATTDIVVGDMLETSGLGRRFPPGYPVAQVTAVDLEAGAAFSTVSAQPLAPLDRGRHVMLAIGEDPDAGEY